MTVLRPGPTNSLTDVPGIRVGHADRRTEGWLSGIIDRRSNFVARSLDHEARVGTPASEGWRTARATGPEGFFTNLTLEKAPFHSVYVNSALTGWSISSMNPADFNITAQFDAGTIAGTSAINSYGGAVTIGPGDAFKVGELVSTLMAGPDPEMRAESAYVELLSGITSYKLDGDTLTLYTNGNETLIFTKVKE